MFTIELSKFFRSEISRTFQFFVPVGLISQIIVLYYYLKWDQDSINGFRLLDSEVRISVRHVTTYNYKILTALRT
ncbi:unnamed protein product [Rhizophagus irregularis]|nr:unnamed protein product [Rhizophagus irregularis]CAB4407501.1 unnamed protein product [Rhizophagus irregularis]